MTLEQSEIDAIIWRRAASLVARAEGCDADDVLMASGWINKRRRWLAIYLVVVSGAVSAKRLSVVAGVSRAAIHQALTETEMRRDGDGDLDRLLDRLARELAPPAVVPSRRARRARGVRQEGSARCWPDVGARA